MSRWQLVCCGAGIFCLIGGGILAWRLLRRNPQPPAGDDPRLTFPTPYKNVRPEVGYAGDEVCARCHANQATAYAKHPMGRSLLPATSKLLRIRFDKSTNNPFRASGLQFLAESRADQLVHTEFWPDSRENLAFEAPMQYAIGSGTRAHSFLSNRDGFLFESSLTWYTQKGMWDLSPGFAANPHGDRMITAECLFCHCNHVEPVPGTLNRFREPIFRGLAIGCERCHGPGELHVRRYEQNEPVAVPDETIVNPGRLSPDLREAVCQQCHLQAEKRILRRGRQPFDYRPGSPVHLFWSIFVRPSEEGQAQKAVGQVEQMLASQCYRSSGGALGCISCHDPHSVPAPEQRVTHYRARCRACHQEKPCRLPPAERLAKTPDDSCIFCHMPRLPSADVAHTAITDHQLLRRYPAPGASNPASDEGLHKTKLPPLVQFRGDDDESPAEEDGRDRAIAFVHWAETRASDRSRRLKLAEDSLVALETALQRAPNDLPAWQAKGQALLLLGRREEALAAFEAELAQASEREEALISAGSVAAQLGRYEAAVAYWHRALAVNPWSATYHYELARVLLLRQEWPAAAREGEATLRLHPFHREARKLLLVCYLQTKQYEKARDTFDRLLRLSPGEEAALRHEYGPQLR
jgi:predicted CXXCH cytochrome family protein